MQNVTDVRPSPVTLRRAEDHPNGFSPKRCIHKTSPMPISPLRHYSPHCRSHPSTRHGHFSAKTGPESAHGREQHLVYYPPIRRARCWAISVLRDPDARTNLHRAELPRQLQRPLWSRPTPGGPGLVCRRTLRSLHALRTLQHPRSRRMGDVPGGDPRRPIRATRGPVPSRPLRRRFHHRPGAGSRDEVHHGDDPAPRQLLPLRHESLRLQQRPIARPPRSDRRVGGAVREEAAGLFPVLLVLARLASSVLLPAQRFPDGDDRITRRRSRATSSSATPTSSIMSPSCTRNCASC